MTSPCNKMMMHLNYKVRVTLSDNRIYIGFFKAFDKCMNLLLDECVELRRTKRQPLAAQRPDYDSREIGFILLRGENIVTVTVEGPPSPPERLFKNIFAPRTEETGVILGAGRGKPYTFPAGAESVSQRPENYQTGPPTLRPMMYDWRKTPNTAPNKTLNKAPNMTPNNATNMTPNTDPLPLEHQPQIPQMSPMPPTSDTPPVQLYIPLHRRRPQPRPSREQKFHYYM